LHRKIARDADYVLKFYADYIHVAHRFIEFG